ncbi:MAG TPA: MASE4 domain-containing protein [Vicinamibacterales bacterium]|jgi:signal transduction histidine kinase|nr:MASE4 domain-containing protein [Vicinamibacterales bacterium]
MQKRDAVVPEEQHFILSTLSPGAAQKRLASAVVVGILVIFALIAFGPLSGVQLRRVDAFVPAYVTAMFVCDSITAILLYAQFSIVRSRSTLVIASGYLFTALVLIPFVLVFPDVFAPGNLIGGLQSTSFLWLSQHAGFPLFVIGYALSKEADPGKRFWQGTVRAAIARSVTLTAALVLVAAFACIAGDPLLPRVASDHLHFSSLWPYFIGAPVALLSGSALVVLWLRRRTVLDLWLMVVLCLYLVEVFLSYYPDPQRFSVGWYAVRVIGFLSSSLVLIVLLYEISTLYARLLSALLAQRREREARLMTGDAVAASIAHEIRQPLTAMVTTADAGLRFLDRSVPNLDRAKEAFKRIVGDGHRAGAVVGNVRANFKTDLREMTSLDVNELINEALALGRGELQKHRIVVQAEPNQRLPEVRGNRVQLQQVLLNLIVNAIDAMAAKDEPRILSVRSEAYEGDRVIVSVADTGTGIRSQDAERIFNPLFTTKADGMGMGLSICRAIIEAHEGRLWYAPNTPRGAVFQFTLPNRGSG